MYAKTILTLRCQTLKVRIYQNRQVPSRSSIYPAKGESLSDWEEIRTMNTATFQRSLTGRLPFLPVRATGWGGGGVGGWVFVYTKRNGWGGPYKIDNMGQIRPSILYKIPAVNLIFVSAFFLYVSSCTKFLVLQNPNPGSDPHKLISSMLAWGYAVPKNFRIW